VSESEPCERVQSSHVDSGFGAESTVVSPHSPYRLSDHERQNTQLKSEPSYHLEADESMEYRTSRNVPQTSTSTPAAAENLTLLDPYLTPERFIHELKQRTPFTIVPLSGRPEFNQAAESVQELFPTLDHEEESHYVEHFVQPQWASPIRERSTVAESSGALLTEPEGHRLVIRFANTKGPATPATNQTEYYTADSRWDTSVFGPLGKTATSPKTPSTYSEATLRRNPTVEISAAEAVEAPSKKRLDMKKSPEAMLTTEKQTRTSTQQATESSLLPDTSYESESSKKSTSKVSISDSSLEKSGSVQPKQKIRSRLNYKDSETEDEDGQRWTPPPRIKKTLKKTRSDTPDPRHLETSKRSSFSDKSSSASRSRVSFENVLSEPSSDSEADVYLSSTQPRHYLKSPKFNGTSTFETFYAQFENCAKYNRWDRSEQLAHLKAALTDTAVHSASWLNFLRKDSAVQLSRTNTGWSFAIAEDSQMSRCKFSIKTFGV